MHARTHKGLGVVHHGWPVVLGPKGSFYDLAAPMTSKASVRYDALSQSQVGSIPRDQDLAVHIGPKAVHADQVVRPGRWVVHLDRGDRVLCGPLEIVAARLRELRDANETSHGGRNCRSSGRKV